MIFPRTLQRMAIAAITCWLALTPMAANGAGRLAGAEASNVVPQLAHISASTPVAMAGTETVALNLVHGPAGHSGYFYSKMPLRFLADGVWTERVVMTVDGAGAAAVTCASDSAGDAVIYFYDVTLGQALPAAVTVRYYRGGSRPGNPPAQQPVIVDATSDFPFGGHYIKGISIPNTIRASVDFKGGQGYVQFSLGGKTPYKTPVGESGTFTYDVDLGRDLEIGLNRLTIIAVPTNGEASRPDDHTFVSFIKLDWLKGLKLLDTLHVEGKGNDAIYVASAEMPATGIQYGAPGFISPEANKQTKVGLFVKGKVTLPIVCGDGHPAKIEGDASYLFNADLYVVDLKGRLTGQGSVVQKFVNCAIFDPELEGKIEVGADISGSKSWNLSNVLRDLLGNYWSVLVTAVTGCCWGDIGLDAKLHAAMGAQAKVQAASPYFKSKLGLEGQTELKGYGNTLFGPAWFFGFSASLGGNGGVVYLSPDYVEDFKQLYLGASYGYDSHIRFSSWWGAYTLYEKTFGVECSYPLKGATSCIGKNMSNVCAAAGEWASHSTSPTYSTFTANNTGPQAFADALPANRPLSSSLVSDVYTYTIPSLAVNRANNHALHVWTYDDPAKALGGSHEIVYSLWNGTAWSGPKPITNDSLLDEAAQVAWTSDGKALALWHRFAQPQDASLPVAPAAARQVELAYAIYDSQTDTWTEPALLTDNAALDMAGVLAHNASGQLMATWTENDGGQATGTPDQPSRIMAAYYDGAWSAPAVAVASTDSVMDLVGGFGDGRAAIAFTRAISPTTDQGMTRDLFAVTWDGQAWSAPLPIANDGSDHDSPNLLFTADNQPVVVWTDRHDIKHINLDTGFQAGATLAPENGSIDLLRILPDQAGNLVAVFRQITGEATIAVSLFDRALGLWSAPRPLTPSGAPGVHSEALTNDGRLLLSYAAAQLTPVPQSQTLADGQKVSYDVPTPGQTDLLTVGYRFARNLSISPDAVGVVIDPLLGANPVITTTVRNSGDYPLANVQVGFYDGPPAAGGALISLQTISGLMPAGQSVGVQTAYTVTAEGGVRTLYAVADPGRLIDESNTADNTASVHAFGPHLSIMAAQALVTHGHDVLLQATVANLGESTAAATVIAFHRDTVTGTVLVTSSIPALGPGATVDVTEPWQFGDLAAGSYPLQAVLGMDVSATETYPFTLDVYPDLALSPYDVQAGNMLVGPFPITATLRNLGVVTATDVVVGFYDAGIRGSYTLVLTQTVPIIGAGEAVVVSAVSPRAMRCGLIVWADPDQAISEERGNNIASLRGPLADCSIRLYLPVVVQ